MSSDSWYSERLNVSIAVVDSFHKSAILPRERSMAPVCSNSSMARFYLSFGTRIGLPHVDELSPLRVVRRVDGVG